MPVKAKVRCWPEGVVVQSIEMEFAAAPLVGDVIEVVDYVSIVVYARLFAPDGSLHLRCDPEPGSDYTPEMIAKAFKEAAADERPKTDAARRRADPFITE